MNCSQILYSSQRIRFSHGYGLAILRLFYINSRTEQINKFIITRVRSLTIGERTYKWERVEKASRNSLMLDWNGKISMNLLVTHTYTYIDMDLN